MTKALTITPKISNSCNSLRTSVIKNAQNASSYLPKQEKSKATRGLVGTVIDLFKAVLNKISKPEDVVSKFSRNTQLPSHKDPAAIVMKSMHG